MKIRVELASGRAVEGTVVAVQDQDLLRSALAGTEQIKFNWSVLLQDDADMMRLVNLAYAESIRELAE